MSTQEYPRLLVATSNNFNLISGGGITLNNLFRGWPRDRIANLHEDPTPEGGGTCGISFQLSSKEMRWIRPLEWLQPNGSEALGTSAGGTAPENALVKLSRLVFGDGVPRRVYLSDSLIRWLKDFKPQLLYTFLGSMAQIRLAHEIVNYCGIPLAIHITDDWPAVIYKRGLLAPMLRRRVMNEFQSILKKASIRMAICEEMCDEYRERWGYRFVPFHNAIDIEGWRPYVRDNWSPGSPFVVRYAGSIVAEAQRHALRDICVAVTNLKRIGYAIEMIVNAPASHRAYLLNDPDIDVRLKDPPDPNTIARLLGGSDLLVLPFNFDVDSSDYTRFSMPTKVPGYLASGTPILLYAPAHIASVRYALREKWGYIVSNPGVDSVRQGILELFENQQLRETLGRRGQQIAAERHNSVRVRAEFQGILRQR